VVPQFAPFPGIRYVFDDLGLVTAPPYDVIDDDERRALVARHPHNIVRVDLPRGNDPYTTAAAMLQDWLDTGVLAPDEPSLYLYRMTFRTSTGEVRHTLGVIGALGLESPGTGDVLPHEHTTPKAKSDRLDLLRATAMNLSPVWGLSLATGLSKHLDPAVAEPLGSWTDDDAVGHELWRLGDLAAIEAITDAVSSAPIVIADGHHRYETCLAFAGERPDLAGRGATMCFVVELVEDQLTVQPIHRLVHGVDSGALTSALATEFALDAGDAGSASPVIAPALVTADGTRSLRRLDTSDTIDSVVLDRALGRLDGCTVTYQHGADRATRAVERGDAVAAVLLRAPTVEQIAATAHARAKMPPKSTFFWPKPRTGTVLRSLR